MRENHHLLLPKGQNEHDELFLANCHPLLLLFLLLLLLLVRRVLYSGNELD